MCEVKENINQSARHEVALSISAQRERIHGEHISPGHRTQPKTGAKDRAGVDTRTAKWQLETGNPAGLTEVCDRRIQEISRTCYRAHPSSFRRINTSLVSAIYFFGAKHVSEIDAGAIEEFISWRITEGRVKDITVRHDLYALSRFFATAIRKRWASNNPIREIEIPSDADAVRIHPLTMYEEQEYFGRAAKYPDLCDVGRLIINQGMRPDEVTHLAKVDIDLSSRLIHIRNGKSSAAKRSVPMTSESNEILEQRVRAQSNWIFPSPRDRRGPLARSIQLTTEF